MTQPQGKDGKGPVSVVEQAVELRRFLDGTGDLEGRSFGDDPPKVAGYPARFWWRRELPRIDAALTLLRQLQEERDETLSVWPTWARAIRAKLQEYGAEVDDVDGSCDLAEAFNEWVDDYATSITEAAEARVLVLETAQAGAVRILSNSELHEVTRILDARDLLILARSALTPGACDE